MKFLHLMRTAAIVAALAFFPITGASAQVQSASTGVANPFASFAGSYHGFGVQTSAEMVFVIEETGRWTVATRGRGKASDMGTLKDGAFKMTLPQGTGHITVKKTGPDAILATIQWNRIIGETPATRCAKVDCTDRARGGHNLIADPSQKAP